MHGILISKQRKKTTEDKIIQSFVHFKHSLNFGLKVVEQVDNTSLLYTYTCLSLCTHSHLNQTQVNHLQRHKIGTKSCKSHNVFNHDYYAKIIPRLKPSMQKIDQFLEIVSLLHEICPIYLQILSHCRKRQEQTYRILDNNN